MSDTPYKKIEVIIRTTDQDDKTEEDVFNMDPAEVHLEESRPVGADHAFLTVSGRRLLEE